MAAIRRFGEYRVSQSWEFRMEDGYVREPLSRKARNEWSALAYDFRTAVLDENLIDGRAGLIYTI